MCDLNYLPIHFVYIKLKCSFFQMDSGSKNSIQEFRKAKLSWANLKTRGNDK